MDYYEELGISPNAGQDEIHRAHRLLTRLLHPDQQTDKAMKLLAETQMRRLNAIIEVLSDPEQRRQYNYSLLGPLPQYAPPATKPIYPEASWKHRLTPHSLPWWVGSTIAAIALIVGVVWFWADNLGSSFGVPSGASTPAQVQDQVSDSMPTSLKASPPSESSPSALSRIRKALLQSRAAHSPVTGPEAIGKPIVQDRSPRFQPGGNAGPVGPQSIAMPAPDRPLPQSSGIEVPPPPSIAWNSSSKAEAPLIPLAGLPVATDPKLPEPVSASTPNTSAVSPDRPVRQNPLEGEWIYVPKEPEKRKPGFYPPEFIHLKLFWDDGGLHGQYQARYQITDKPISPDVSFVLSPTDKEARRFVWQSRNGSRGTFKISSIDHESIRVEWRTTAFTHRTTTLAAGMATLVRRSP